MRSTLSRPIILAALLASAGILPAQQLMEITKPTSIDVERRLDRNKKAVSAMHAAGLDAFRVGKILVNNRVSVMPPGLLTDSSRIAEAPYIMKYKAYRLCEFQIDEVKRSVVMIPAQENLHMPDELRPRADIYLDLPDSAINIIIPTATNPMMIDEPSWKGRDKVKIIKPDDVYATYDLRNDEVGKKALLELISPEQLETVIFRSHESNWPEAMNTFDERWASIDQFKRYKAFYLGEWDGKVLLIVPDEKNKKMRRGLRPYSDLYLIYAKSALKL